MFFFPFELQPFVKKKLYKTSVGVFLEVINNHKIFIHKIFIQQKVRKLAFNK